jgi:hypothetical protein
MTCEASTESISLNNNNNHYQTARQFLVHWTEFDGGLFEVPNSLIKGFYC